MSRLLLFDIGNTHTHLGIADAHGIRRQCNLSTAEWRRNAGAAAKALVDFTRGRPVEGVALCSVVPAATPLVSRAARRLFDLDPLILTPQTLRGIGINYPRPETIGPDRLANAVAVQHHFGAPAVVVDFGTAVTFDVVDRQGNYAGGIIAPGLAAMTDYLHEKTALLPRIRIRETSAVIGKNTEQAMLIGAVHGYRGLIRELLGKLRSELKCRKLPVVATGGYAKLLASRIPEITAVDPLLTLEGIRLTWLRHEAVL
jgi:type III pantothenate kinase